MRWDTGGWRDAGDLASRLKRGTSPRAIFPLPHPWTPAFAGVVGRKRPGTNEASPIDAGAILNFPYVAGMLESANPCSSPKPLQRSY